MLILRHLFKRKTSVMDHILHPHPHPHTPYRILDYCVYVAATIGPIMTLPQIYLIWGKQSAAGVSEISWLTYSMTSALWLAYGLAHKDKPLIISNILWLVVNIAVTVGAVLY